MRTTQRWWGRGAAALAALTLLGACTLGREPAYDAAIADEVTGLTARTLVLFQSIQTAPQTPFGEREETYRLLAAQAGTIRLMAEARGAAAPARGLGLSQRLTERLERRAGERIGIDRLPGSGSDRQSRLAEYTGATPAYMADYLRNLNGLEALDRAANGNWAGTEAALQARLAEHTAATEAYIDAFRLWQQGSGPEPEAPGPPPAAAADGLDPDLAALRLTAIEDILRDTLVYERDILNRAR